MIRPFLLLVSMHPATRISIGELLGIEISDWDDEKEIKRDPHYQAWKLLHTPLKGIGAVAGHSWETLNPSKILM